MVIADGRSIDQAQQPLAVAQRLVGRVIAILCAHINRRITGQPAMSKNVVKFGTIVSRKED